MDRVKHEDVEKLVEVLELRFKPALEDEIILVQTRLLLEIRDLLAEAALKLANPLQVVDFAPKKPRRSQIRAHRTTWICKEEGKATFMCVDCRRLVEVVEDQMRGFKGPLITVRCHRCQRAFSLDSRQLDGEFGRMMRAHFPKKDES